MESIISRFMRVSEETTKVIKKILEKIKKQENFLEEVEKLLEEYNNSFVLIEILKENFTDFEVSYYERVLSSIKEDILKIKELVKKECLIEDKTSQSDFLNLLTGVERDHISLVFLTINKSLEIKSPTIEGFKEIQQILENKNLINIYWSPAVLLLQSIELVVNKKLEKMGLNWKDYKFEDRLPLLGIDEGGMIINNAFWALRAKVLHEGYLPDEDELEIMKIGSRRIIKKLLLEKS